MSTNGARGEFFNNILYGSAGGSRFAITSGSGQNYLENNWLPTGWRLAHESSLDPGARVEDLGNVEGSQPGFLDFNHQDFRLSATAVDCADNAMALPGPVADHPVQYQYVPHEIIDPRLDDGSPDMGAYERE